nr:MAG TPA: FAM76 protein [Caudoviricetes sp.]
MEKIMIIQQISTICDNLPAKMKKAKEDQHKTNQQIIDSTGLSESTVKKFFSGHLSGPSIYDVTAMAIDLGLSLDELMELSPPKQDQSTEINQLKTEIAHKQEMLAEKDKAISRLEDRSHIMENEISTVRSNWKEIAYVTSGLSVLFGLFLMVYVFLDLRNPNLGLFRGTTAAPIVYVAVFAIAGTFLYIVCKAKRKKEET